MHFFYKQQIETHLVAGLFFISLYQKPLNVIWKTTKFESRDVSDLPKGIQRLTPSALTSRMPQSFLACTAQCVACSLALFILSTILRNQPHSMFICLWLSQFIPFIMDRVLGVLEHFKKPLCTVVWIVISQHTWASEKQMSPFGSSNMWLTTKLDTVLWSGCQKMPEQSGCCWSQWSSVRISA